VNKACESSSDIIAMEKVNMNWFIKECDDYHEICAGYMYSPKGKWKAIELGCFVPHNGLAHKYYGLFYTGQKPSKKQILGVLNTIASFVDDDYECRPIEVEDISQTV